MSRGRRVAATLHRCMTRAATHNRSRRSGVVSSRVVRIAVDTPVTRNPTVSVVIPAYDQPDMLREALDSVAAQDFENFEVLVIDDGSPRDLRPAVVAAGENLGGRLRYVRQENAGGSAARNRGVALARGEWVALLDHDDVWVPSKLRRQMEIATAHPEAALVYCQYQDFGDESTAFVSPRHPSGTTTLADLLGDTLIRTLSVVMIRRDALGEEPWFDTRYSGANDIDLYYRIAERHSMQFLAEILVRKRSHPEQVSRNRLAGHDEMVAIVDRLDARLREASGGMDPDLERRVQRRLAIHLLGAAKAARAEGLRLPSRERYRRLTRVDPWRVRGWRGLLGTYL